MEEQNIKNKLKAQLKNFAWRAITTVILTLTAIITVWVYAAFVEPTVGPNDSDQDFAQNILGANNADNDFDSSAVATNKDGSIAERLEYITNRMTTAGQWYSLECDDSTTTATSTCYVDDTAKYVDSNACLATSNTGYCFMNTATFSAMDSDLAVGNVKKNVTIFGIAGTYERPAQTTCSGPTAYKECSNTGDCSARVSIYRDDYFYGNDSSNYDDIKQLCGFVGAGCYLISGSGAYVMVICYGDCHTLMDNPNSFVRAGLCE